MDDKAKAIAESRARLENWITRTFEDPPEEGRGRNNWMIMLCPRMLEVGHDQDSIFEMFKNAFGLEDDDSKDDEIKRAISSAAKYATPIRIESNADHADRKRKEEDIRNSAVRRFDTIQLKYPWEEAEILADGGISDWTPREQFVGFMQHMWNPLDNVWIGRVQDSGQPIHRRNFRAARAWQLAGIPGLWEFTSHATFVPGALSRGNQYLSAHKFMVVESDVLSTAEIGAIFRYLSERLELNLRAVVFSGNASLHGWFDWPGDSEVEELKIALGGLRCDPSTMRTSQPVRLAGHTRCDTGKIQRLLYLR